jgi:hypothetical protein
MIESNELVRMWKEAVVVSHKVYYGIGVEGLGKTLESSGIEDKLTLEAACLVNEADLWVDTS